MMQVPTSITLNNGNSSNNQRMQSNAYFTDNMNFHMDIPDKLTSNLMFKINKILQSVYNLFYYTSSW